MVFCCLHLHAHGLKDARDQYFPRLICHTVVQFQAAFAKFRLVTQFCHPSNNSDEKEAGLQLLQPILLTSLKPAHRYCVFFFFFCSLNFLEKKQQSEKKSLFFRVKAAAMTLARTLCPY